MALILRNQYGCWGSNHHKHIPNSKIHLKNLSALKQGLLIFYSCYTFIMGQQRGSVYHAVNHGQMTLIEENSTSYGKVHYTRKKREVRKYHCVIVSLLQDGPK